MLTFVLALFTLASCYEEEEDNGTDVVLIKDGVAQFKVVYSLDAGNQIRRAAISFVEELRDLGVEVEDAISDSDAIDIAPCEILIGTDIKNCPDGCAVSVDDIGENGYVIKAVGKRIVIVAGTVEGTKNAISKFMSEHLGVEEDTETLKNVRVKEGLLDELINNNTIFAFNIAGNPIADFVVAYDFGEDSNILSACPSPTEFTNAIKTATGIDLTVKKLSETSRDDKRIVIKLVDNAGKDGFRAYVYRGELIIECAYWNKFAQAFKAYINDEITGKSGTVELDSGYSYTYPVSSVTYEEFGAVGDGKTNDIDAIRRTHEFANQCGQKVIADDSANYYIGLIGGKSVPIMTDTDFGSATFTIDDTAPGVYHERGVHIFHIMREADNEPIYLNEADIKALAGTDDPQVLRTYDSDGNLISGSIPWLARKLTSGAMIMLNNANHSDYIRFGVNRNLGNPRCEMIIVDKDGKIDDSTPVIFDYTDITSMSIFYTDDDPITVEGGRFYNVCCRVVPETENLNIYREYARGFLVERCNTTMRSVDHKMKNEPKRFVNGVDGFNQGYPYFGFIVHSKTYNSKAISCDFTDRKVYAMHPTFRWALTILS